MWLYECVQSSTSLGYYTGYSSNKYTFLCSLIISTYLWNLLHNPLQDKKMIKRFRDGMPKSMQTTICIILLALLHPSVEATLFGCGCGCDFYTIKISSVLPQLKHLACSKAHFANVWAFFYIWNRPWLKLLRWSQLKLVYITSSSVFN